MPRMMIQRATADRAGGPQVWQERMRTYSGSRAAALLRDGALKPRPPGSVRLAYLQPESARELTGEFEGKSGLRRRAAAGRAMPARAAAGRITARVRPELPGHGAANRGSATPRDVENPAGGGALQMTELCQVRQVGGAAVRAMVSGIAFLWIDRSVRPARFLSGRLLFRPPFPPLDAARSLSPSVASALR